MWTPPVIDSTDVATWDYTNRDRHFWPPEGTVPEDAKLIVDLGCNAGFSTGLLADAFPKAKVIGVEMDPVVADRAKQNVAGFEGRVQIMTTAVGWPEREEGAIFNISNAVSRLRPYEIDHSGYTTYPMVNVMSFDNVLKATGVFGQQIDFLKMDVEGAEGEINRDGGEWSKFTKVYQCESHYDPGDVLEELLKGMGFSIMYNHKGQITGYKDATDATR